MFSRPVHAGSVIIAVALFAAAGCARKTVARVPAPPIPARLGATETGIASWYGVPYHGRRAASGEIYDMEKLTAAHRTLPFDTWVEVMNLSNGKRVDVRITDRGPFVSGRIIDLSRAAARQISMLGPGVAKVRLEVIPPPATPLRAEPEPPPLSAPPSVPQSPSPSTVRGTEPNGFVPSDDEPNHQEPGQVEPSPMELDRGEPAPVPPDPEPVPPLVSPPGSPQPAPKISSSPRAATEVTNSAASSTTSGSTSAGWYVVQAGAFADRGRAEALQSLLVKKFGEARVVRGQRNPPLWRVFVGRQMTAVDASDLAAQVLESGTEAEVVPEP